MSKWVEIRKGGDFVALGNKLNIDPVVARILVNRGIAEDECESFLRGELKDIESIHNIKNLDSVCSVLKEKIDSKKKIRIIGDYDVDGVCASYILYKSISRVGGIADVYLPDRVKDGYGLNIGIVEQCISDGIDTIITCDNGIAADKECRRAKEAGITVIVTDHHEVPYHFEEDKKVLDIPEADVVCDLKQEGDAYSYREICGANLTFKIAQGLYELYGIKDIYEFADMAAFATIEDVMPLTGENRILVKEGLKRLNNTDIPGMRALMEVSELADKNISTYHVGFILGPCINAAGRMENATLALDLLLSDADKSLANAAYLKSLNDSRKLMTEEAVSKAVSMLDENDLPHVIVSYLESVNESIVGIVAGRLKEMYLRPVIVLTNTENGLKGSGRSISEYNLFEKLNECKELFSKFGGHAAAAGLSISCGVNEIDEKLTELSDFLNSHDGLSEDVFEGKTEIDVVMPFSYISEGLVNDLSLLEPFGNGFKHPVFATRKVKLNHGQRVGKTGRTFKCFATDESGKTMDAIYFGDEEKITEIEKICKEGTMVSMIYEPSINEFRGVTTLQIKIKEIK